MEETLMDVSNAIANRRTRNFKRLRCFVVNYTATNDFPNKFYYFGCNVQRANGTFCARASCEHKGIMGLMYRFQMQLTDRSPSPPLTVTIFDQAHLLMGIPAEKLQRKSHDAQLAMVREVIARGESVDIYLRVKEDSFSGEFVPVVQVLTKVDDVANEVLNELMGTPTYSPRLRTSPGNFQTPRGEESGIGSTSERSSSAQRRASGGRPNSSQLSTVKTKLLDLIDIIDLTTLED